MALALDGHVTGTWSSGTTFATAGLTTVNAGDVIVAVVSMITGSLTVSSITGSGIVWNGAPRKRLSFNTTGDLELWYGTAASTLAAVVVTVHLSGTPTSAFASVFGISGANTVSISDSNASLPASATGGGSIPTTTGVSTTNANDMIIAGSGGTTVQTAGATFSLIDAIAGVASEEKVVSVTQSAVSVVFGTSNTGNWGMIVDAVQAGVTPVPSSTALQLPDRNWNTVVPVAY